MLDRNTHEQLYEIPITSRTNWDAVPTVEGCIPAGPPGWHGMERSSLQPSDEDALCSYGGLVRCHHQVRSRQLPPTLLWRRNHLIHAIKRAAGRSGHAATGKVRWPAMFPALAAAVTAAGGMLFTGDLENNFLAIDAAAASALQFNTGGGRRRVVSYELKANGTSPPPQASFPGCSGTSSIVVFALP